MALFSECMLECARKVLDTADIVRDAIYRQLSSRRPRHPSRFSSYEAGIFDSAARTTARAECCATTGGGIPTSSTIAPFFIEMAAADRCCGRAAISITRKEKTL